MTGLSRLTRGHINSSWELDGAGPLGTRRYLLQRLNPSVFPDGPVVHRNIGALTDHLRRAAEREGVQEVDRRVMRLAHLPDGAPAWQALDGAWWRLLLYIEHTRTVTQVTDPAEAEQVGRAFGTLHRWLADYDGPPITETLPSFHDSAARLARLELVVAEDRLGRVAEVIGAVRDARSRSQFAGVLPPLLATGALPRRIVHNDAKAANVLLDAVSGASLAVVDLDTVMPGTLLSDVGDLIRSLATHAAEDERELDRITVELPLVESLAGGFFAECGRILVPAEREQFVFAGLLLTWEQGVRFLTDHLEGDRYYAIQRPGHNRDRAQAQFRLLAGLEQSREALESCVAGL
ncbi:MAG: phosphotransferase [Gemmatimonadales bacterium]